MNRERENRNPALGHVAQTPARIDDVAPQTPNASNAAIRPAGRENAPQAENRHAIPWFNQCRCGLLPHLNHELCQITSHSSTHIAAITPYDGMTAATAHTNESGTRTLEHCATEDCDVSEWRPAYGTEAQARHLPDRVRQCGVRQWPECPRRRMIWIWRNGSRSQ